MMTVEQLIATLRRLPPELPVHVIAGTERYRVHAVTWAMGADDSLGRALMLLDPIEAERAKV